MKPLTIFVLALLVSISLFAQNPTPFNCSQGDGFGYYISSASYTLSGQNLTYENSRLSRITTLSGERVTLCESAQIGVSLNGLGFNPHDQFLYAVSRYDDTEFSGKLFRIGENCQRMEIPVTGSIVQFNTNNVITIDAAGGNISSGTFDVDNNYYVNTSFTNETSTGFTNKLQKIEIVGNEAFVRSTVTLTCPSCIGTDKLRINDIIFDEESSILYGNNKVTNKIYTINPTNGILTEVGETGISSAILGMYKNRDGNVRAISEGGNIYDVNITSGVFTLMSNVVSLNSGNADGASGCYVPPSISGFLFTDSNGLSDNQVGGIGTKSVSNTTLSANLIQNGTIINAVTLNADGSYQFTGLLTGTYVVQISANKGTIGQPSPSQSIPSTYAFVGDHIGAGPGNDGSPDGELTVIISGGADVTNVNFGVDGIPQADDINDQTQPNPGGTTQVDVSTLSISDPEENNINNITIQQIPDPGTQGVLYYNGSVVTNGFFISDYNPSLLTVDPIDGSPNITFTYSTTDMANLQSNIATVTMPFSAPLPVAMGPIKAEYRKGKVYLNWSTFSEIQNDYFMIERSLEGIRFSEIGKISGAGNSLSTRLYEFADENPVSGALYRVTQFDWDGNKTSYPLVRVIFNDSQTAFRIYPTMVRDVLYVHIPENEDAYLFMEFLDMTGRLLKSMQVTSGLSNLSVADLPNGQFIVSLRTPEHSTLFTERIIKTGL